MFCCDTGRLTRRLKRSWHKPITLGLALFWQDVGTSAVVHYLAFVPADVFQFSFCTYFQLLVINLAAVLGGRFPNSKTTPSPDRSMLCHWTNSVS